MLAVQSPSMSVCKCLGGAPALDVALVEKDGHVAAPRTESVAEVEDRQRTGANGPKFRSSAPRLSSSSTTGASATLLSHPLP